MENGLKGGIYEEVSCGYAKEKREERLMISSAFTVWNGEAENRKGLFVINLHGRVIIGAMVVFGWKLCLHLRCNCRKATDLCRVMF